MEIYLMDLVLSELKVIKDVYYQIDIPTFESESWSGFNNVYEVEHKSII